MKIKTLHLITPKLSLDRAAKKILFLVSTRGVFTVIVANGTHISWRDRACGCIHPDATEVLALDIRRIRSITSTASAFFALLDEGSLFA